MYAFNICSQQNSHCSQDIQARKALPPLHTVKEIIDLSDEDVHVYYEGYGRSGGARTVATKRQAIARYIGCFDRLCLDP
jgi:hypothetical protein